jgi:predicted O-linked N-acetylglucosamine transferase (SPINDLY family)
MARVMALQGQQEAANRAYNDAAHAALATGGDAPRQVHWLMGQYVLEMGHAAESLVCFDHALKAAKTETPEALTNLRAEVQMDAAKAYLVLGQRDAAIRLLTLASAATQEATLSRLAALSFRNNFWQEAIEVSRRCVGLFAQSQWAHWNLAHLLAECWQMEEAEEVLQRAEAIAPMPGARSLRASVAGRVGDADAALALYTELAKESAADATFASSAAMSSLYSDKLSAQAVADLHRSLFASWGKGARSRESFVRKPREGRRLRLGIVSADFHHQHPVNIFMQPVLRELDRTRFELFMYFVGDSHDEQTALARSRVAHWQEVGALNTTQLAKRIDADEMLVEAYVKPSEVAFLHVGQKAVVKLSSYDFNKYGGLDGELEHLSPDTLKDERQQRKPGGNPVDMEEGYYRILVRIKDTHLVRNGKRLEPTPGMTATVEIRTGQKTVLEYLFRPLQNVSQALRER